MRDEDKKKEELISELTGLRHQIYELKTFEHTHKSAESALLESQRTLTTPMGDLPGMAYRCRNDCDWTMEYVSDGCVALTGYRPVELIENSRVSYAQLIHPEDQEYVWNEIQTALKERRPFKLVYRITMADGRQKWVWEQGCGIFSHDGELLCLEGFITDITDLRQSEEHARKQSILLEAINKVLRETLWCETEEEVARVCLAVAEELTGSEFGFVGETNNEGRFDTIALSNPGWDGCKMPESNAVKMIKDMEIRGIWGKVLKDKQPLIVNDPASHPARIGTPGGHPPLTSFLGIPLRYMGKTIGMIALANKKQGYDLVDQHAVETLSLSFVEVLNRKRAAKELMKAKDHLENIVESSLDGIIVGDSVGNITSVNKSFLKLVGYEEQEIIGKHIMVLSLVEKGMYESTTGERVKIDEEFFKDAKAMTYDRLFKEGKITNWETYYLRKDKKVVPVEQNIVYLFNDEGTLKGSVGVVRDVAERKIVENKIKETSEFLNNVFKTSVDGIIITDSKGFITMANDATEKMLGYAQGELVGMATTELGSKGEVYEKAGKEFITQLFEKGFVLGEGRTWLRKDGSLINIEINSALLKDKDDNTTGAVSTIRDITERKKTDEALRATNQKLVAREQELSAINQQLQASNQQLKASELALRESKERYHDLIEFANAGIITVENEKIIQVNRKAEEFYGYSKDELIGQSTRILTPEHYRKKHSELLNEYLTSGNVGKMLFEEEGIRKDGSLFPIEISFSLSRRGEDSIIIAVMRDITERKKSEEALRESEERYRLSTEYVPLHLGAIDQSGKFILWNKYSEKMLGYTADEVIGKMSSHTIHESEEDAEEVIRIASESGMYDKEINLVHKSKSVVPVHLVVVPKKTEGGEITGFYGFAEDVTARKKAEEATKKSEEKYHNMIEHANDAIVSVNKEGIVLSFNKKAEEMFGYARDEIVGKSIVLLSPKNIRKQQRKLLEEFKTTNKMYIVGKTLEGKGLRRDGCEFPLEGSTFVFEINGESILTVIIRDISERKKMEEKLIQSEKLRALGELSGGVAHDFNNVLAAILGRVQLLKMHLEPPPGKQGKRKSMRELKEELNVIERAALDGAETVRRIQEFSRRRADEKIFTRVDVNELLDNALEFTRMRWKNEAESKGIRINIKTEFLPLPCIAGSPSELREVFTNLINNALDAMPQGGEIRVTTFMDNSHAVIKIEDTGDGIPKDIRERIFDPFFTTKGVQSTGLGLSVSYGIVHRHQGTIAVESIEDQGATFIIRLPLSENTVRQKGKSGEITHVPRVQRKAKILVIEDEEDVRKLLEDILIDAGHEVCTATGGSQGVELFKRGDFDLVLTDLGMSGMSGWQVAEEIKKVNGKIPIALITGWRVPPDEYGLRKSGIDLVINKPFKVEEVLKLVQEGLSFK